MRQERDWLIYIGGTHKEYLWWCADQHLASFEVLHVHRSFQIRGMCDKEFIVCQNTFRCDIQEILMYCRTHNITEVDSNDYA